GRTVDKPLVLDDAKAKADARSKELNVRVHELEKQVGDSSGAKHDFLAQKLEAARAELAALAASSSSSSEVAAASVRVSALPLPRGFPEDADVKRALDAYTKSIPSLVASCEANVKCAPPKDGQATYIGAVACAKCHEPAYKFWQKATVQLPGKDAQGRPVMRTEGHVHAWN